MTTIAKEPKEVIDVDDAEALKKSRRRKPDHFDPSVIPKNKKKKKRHATRSVLQSITQPNINVKVKNLLGGIIQCPCCPNKILVGATGCNVVTCTNHHPNYHYFCYHCKAVCIDGISRCSCSHRNNVEARTEEQKKRNEAAARNIIDITS
jgi:hypothetical protein